MLFVDHNIFFQFFFNAPKLPTKFQLLPEFTLKIKDWISIVVGSSKGDRNITYIKTSEYFQSFLLFLFLFVLGYYNNINGFDALNNLV